MKDKKPIYINISLTSIFKISLFFIFLYLLFFFRNLIALFLTAVLLSTIIEPLILRFKKIKIPRIVSVTLIYIILIFLILAASIIYFPLILKQLNVFLTALPENINTLNLYLFEKTQNSSILHNIFSNIQEKIQNINIVDLTNSIGKMEALSEKNIGGFFIGLIGGFLNFILIIVMSFYLAIQKHSIENLIKKIVPIKHIKYSLSLWRRSQRKIILWFEGRILVCFIIGFIIYAGLKLFFNLEQAALLAFISGFFELIPFLGPYISAIPALIIAMYTGGVPLAISILIFYLIVQIIESQFVLPIVVKKMVGIPTVLVLISFVMGAQLFGFLGALLSIPVSAVLMEYLKDLDKKRKSS